MYISERKTFQVEKTPSTKTLRQQSVFEVKHRPEYLELNEEGRMVVDEVGAGVRTC